ncbi:TonB-dependent receptor [Tenacibaculum discolor]|uniref:TonB-dependent receptor n=1 Tax=Tenacibaculum discolor TaxID=361581 RepID=A0A2G1BW40_9FLAO|nr:carboxypeptidase-like regulatory domain-containing protein [Tenacibaculum discolor]MDP2540295.1 TonB-dependent receptor plug domain-containing protein [Tenacibaculum discolor]PHN98240.1 TonB-dependent receptor [Tenacibaculum discolor]PHO01663.1 TonB-dependent receptor [Rhodobacteraceae bacterium 4F10]
MNNNNFFFFLIFFWSFSFGFQAQIVTEKIPLKKVLKQIANTHNIQFNYNSNSINNILVSSIPKKLSLKEKLKKLEDQTDLIFTRLNTQIIAVSSSVKICGYLKDATTNTALIGATIKAETNYTTTDNNGFFELKVRRTSETVSIRFIGYHTIKKLSSDLFSKNCNVLYLREHQELIPDVTINGYLVKGIDKTINGNTVIDFSKFTLLPGLIETDVLQTVQALPGIQSVDETVSNITIRGGSHDQNLILWDDIKMYQTGHFFGLISSFNPKTTQNVQVITNGTSASYSNGVSGTIHMKTEDILQTAFTGSFSINFINANIFTDIPLGKKSSLQLAARRSIDDWIKTPTYHNYFKRVTQSTEIENNEKNVTNSNQEFNFYDTSLRWLYTPSDKDFIRVNFILIDNSLTFDETAVVSNSIETKQSSLSQKSIAGGINYRRKWNSKFSTTLNIYETDYTLQAINANILDSQRFLQENIVSETGIKIEGNYTNNSWKYNSGYSFTETQITNLNDVDNPRFVRLYSNVIREHAVFGQTQYQNSNANIIIKPGVRVNYIEKFKETFIEPRLSIHKKINDTFSIEVLGEFKHQNVSQIINFQNDFLGIEKRRWQLSDNDSIPIIRSKQASVGFTYKKKQWLLDATGYYKAIDGITTQSQSFTTKYEFSKNKGSYNALGIDFLLRKNFKNLNTWLSYSFIKNTYSFDNLVEKKFPSNFDITHSVTLGSTYSNEYFNISLGLNYTSGKPTTQPIFGNEITNDKINFDTANSSKIDNSLRADASAMYKKQITDKINVDIGVSVWNLFNTQNTLNNYYRVENNNANKYARYSLGTTPNFLLKLNF